MFISDIRARNRGHGTALQDEEVATSYVLFEIQESLNMMGGQSLSSLDLSEAPADLPPLVEETNEAEQQQESLRGTIIESAPLLNDSQRAVFDAIVGAELPGVCPSDVDAPVSGQGAQVASQARVFFLDVP